MATRKPNYTELHSTLSFIAFCNKSVENSSCSLHSLSYWVRLIEDFILMQIKPLAIQGEKTQLTSQEFGHQKLRYLALLLFPLKPTQSK